MFAFRARGTFCNDYVISLFLSFNGLGLVSLSKVCWFIFFKGFPYFYGGVYFLFRGADWGF
ncbi:MAG: hypothetical protein FD143_2900 [Ignavibacteria bacterium]|nr:MAG: hypothetical protein FD143_2900 [Ignavibacteria bacterium]